MPIFNRPLPKPLRVLRELALDLHWSWNHDSDQLWREINDEVWTHTQNPLDVLHLTSDQRMTQLADDPEFIQRLDELVNARRTYLTEPSWYERRYADESIPGVAYLSMEFGLCDALPLYAGGLGMLAGDYLKTASDLGVPIVGVGLLYQEGYFHQSLDGEGWQQETYLYNDPGSLPLTPLHAEDGTWLHIDTEFLCRRVRFRVWQAQIGRVTLYLLDSNDPRNQASDRGITSKLYGGTTELRLVQEIALGICGWRLIETLGLGHYLCHLNEGHAAFATLERIRSYQAQRGGSFDQALWATRAGNLFTTHTPVAAGFDQYPVELLRRYIGEFTQELGVPLERLIALGRLSGSSSSDPFNMAYLAMNTCLYSNGVSQLHGQVSRRIFQNLYPRWPEREVPVGHVTNGVHVPTWDSPRIDNAWEQAFGPDRWRKDLSHMKPSSIDTLDDQSLWQMVGQGRAQLVAYARTRLQNQWRNEATLGQCTTNDNHPLDPNLFTVGFARRFAEYKRPNLLLWDTERLTRLLTDSQQPMQLIIAGKAHPADRHGKAVLQAWYRFAQQEHVRHRVVILEDYDIELAQHLVQGVDLWLNTPRRPWEASGTSGMKILVNGGLNLSTLDGWWAEAYQPDNGWALGDGQEHDSSLDGQDAEQLYHLLENEIAPMFYRRDSEDLPTEWLKRMRTSMSQLTGQYSCNRMIKEYLENYYQPGAKAMQSRFAQEGKIAKELDQWHTLLHKHWHEVHIGRLQVQHTEETTQVNLHVYLGGLTPDAIKVQLGADPKDDNPAVTLELLRSHSLEGGTHAYCYEGHLPSERPVEDFTPRVIGFHPNAEVPSECGLINWQDRS